MPNKTWSHKQLAIYLLVVSVMILGLINFSIYRKQQILQSGARVFLELRPVDPRSLMQGDYMRLAYKLEQNLGSNTPNRNQNARELWVKVDAQHIGTASRVASGKPAANEYIFKFNRGQIQPNSFMFQEGHADIYAMARYAVFTFAKGSRSDYVLSALADKDLRTIEPPH